MQPCTPGWLILASTGSTWLPWALLQPIRLASSTELTGMNWGDLVTHSGRLRATWATRCAALHDWLPRTGFNCLDLAALGDQPVELIRLASSTELTNLGANENPNA